MMGLLLNDSFMTSKPSRHYSLYIPSLSTGAFMHWKRMKLLGASLP